MLRQRLNSLISAAVLTALPLAASAEPKHGIAMYGEPQLEEGFISLPYANPDAPKGGKIVSGEAGSFDSLNPHIRKGQVPWQLRFIAYESLMGRSWDEPFSLYGLLAETIDVDPAGTWVEFQLHPDAKFSDGAPVTVEDVLWSYETLGTIGHPRYHGAWKKIEKAEAVGERGVRFTFNVEDRELALIMGLRPILKKAQWEGKDFAESGLDDIPISSAPYVIDDFFVMNTRRDVFKDWRVRDAMIHAFNFEFINQTINGGVNPRITSYFANSVLGMEEGPATGKVKELLEPFAGELLPGAMDGYTLPVAENNRNRSNITRATELMAEAGWTVQDGVMKNEAGAPFTFEVLLKNSSTENEHSDLAQSGEQSGP